MPLEKALPGKANHRTILIVADEERMFSELDGILRKYKYKICFYSSEFEALEFLKKNDADIIIANMNLPEISGIEFLKRSSEMNPSSLRIILSEDEEKETALQTVQSGIAQQYIITPWDEKELVEIVEDLVKLQQKIVNNNLQEIIYSFNNIPSPPRLHSKLLEILESENQSHKSIIKEIEKSPSLVSRLLRISNSVFYWPRKPISNVSEAVSFIGTKSVLDIVLGLESFEIIKSIADKKILQFAEDIRKISIVRAHVAREIAVQWAKENEQHEAYVAALLLDIGLILRFCSFPDKFDEFYHAYKIGKNPAYQIDRQIFPLTHDEIGAALLSYWNFPHSVITAIANHHHYGGNDSLTLIVQLANALTSEKDSNPHDPFIDKYLIDWQPRLNKLIETMKNFQVLFQ